MTNHKLNYRFTDRRSAYANFISYLEYLNKAQPENRDIRRCIVRIVKLRGFDGEMTARDGWKAYCESARYQIGKFPHGNALFYQSLSHILGCQIERLKGNFRQEISSGIFQSNRTV